MTTRRILLGAAALVALAIAAWWPLAGRKPDHRENAMVRGADRLSAMPEMAGDGSVVLTADQIRTFGVTFATVEQRELAPAVRVTGIVTLDETRLAQVTSKVSGFIERLDVDFTGQEVRRGQSLYALYSPDLVSAQAELLAASRLSAGRTGTGVPGLAGADGDLLDATRRRLRLWDVSESQITEVLRRGAPQRTIAFFSPMRGVVTDKQVVRGQAIEAGQPLYTIADLSTVWVEADLRESDAGAVREGSTAEIELAAFPGRPMSGRVTFVAPVLRGGSRSVRARIEVPNTDAQLKPGMYGTVRIATPGRHALAVPAEAVIHTGERSIVFVDLLGGQLSPREIETGMTAGGFTEVLAGLEPGQRVVTSAQYLLESESNLGDLMRGMIGQTGTAGMEGMQMDAGSDTADRSARDSLGADLRGMPGMTTPERR